MGIRTLDPAGRRLSFECGEPTSRSTTCAKPRPLNNALAAAGAPDQITDLTQVRNAFESAWVRWNTARTVAHTAALGCLIWALVIYGRTRAGA
ncbi:MAG: anthrone oxygenase family protein [Pseudonocardiales bacterium]